MRNKFIIFALLLIAFIVYTRMRYHAQFLYSWDSVSFALSIESFNMKLHQPHPPGYILYSYTLRLLNHFIGDANKSMIFLNIAATIGACWFIAKLIYDLTRKEIAAMGAAALYAANPVSLFYGCVAEIYAVEGFLVSWIAYLIMIAHNRERYLIWATIAMAVAGGFRQTTEIFLLPLYATAFLRKKNSTRMLALSVLLIGNLLWFWPLTSSVGGVAEYIDAVRGQSERAAETAMEGPAERMTWRVLAARTVQAITIPILIAWIVRFKQLRLSWKESSLLIAIAPAMILFSILHFPKDGYLLLVIPLIIVLSVLLLQRAIESSRSFVGVIALSCAIGILSFLFPFERTGMPGELTRPNKDMIANRTHRLKRFFEIADGLGGGEHKTFVLENRHYFPSWRMLLYYYPEDTVYLLWPNRKRAYVAANREYTTIVAPLRVMPNSTVVAVGKTFPELTAQSFQVNSYRYYFFEPGTLPHNFQLYSMRFLVSADE